MAKLVQNKKNKNVPRLATSYIVKVAFMSALLTALKFALSFIPNVEVVTVLICVYASVFGIAYALPATLIFCAVEVAIYGVGSWVLLYFVYWPMLAVCASLLLKGGRPLRAILLGAMGTFVFSLLSACCDTLFCIGYFSSADLAKYWVAYFMRGLPFLGIHVASNLVVFLLLYTPMTSVCKRVFKTYCRHRALPRRLRNLDCEYVMERKDFAD